MPAKAMVDKQLATGFHHLQEQNIVQIHRAIEFHVYRTKATTTIRCWYFQVHLNSTLQTTMKFSDADL